MDQLLERKKVLGKFFVVKMGRNLPYAGRVVSVQGLSDSGVWVRLEGIADVSACGTHDYQLEDLEPVILEA